MKIRFILLTALLTMFACLVKAQCPEAFNYQTGIRDANGNPLANTFLGVRFTIMDSVDPGSPVYQETFRTNTGPFGRYDLNPGFGSPTFGTFSSIKWPTGHKYMQVELDLTGTGNYINMGTEFLASVPYALYCDSARTGGYPQHHIGEHYGGGIVFYVTGNGQHGLIADSTDLQTGTDTVLWANVDTAIVNTTLSGTGGGYINTERIVINQGAGNYAASLCANYTGGGYGDWFLPSATELILLYQQQHVIGNFNSSAAYWSSTENAKSTATALSFGTGISMAISKATAGNVRAVRAF